MSVHADPIVVDLAAGDALHFEGVVVGVLGCICWHEIGHAIWSCQYVIRGNETPKFRMTVLAPFKV